MKRGPVYHRPDPERATACGADPSSRGVLVIARGEPGSASAEAEAAEHGARECGRCAAVRYRAARLALRAALYHLTYGSVELAIGRARAAVADLVRGADPVEVRRVARLIRAPEGAV